MKRSDHVLPDGAVVSVRTDITEIKEREQALRESEARFRAIFEDAQFGIAIATLDGHMVRCNPAWTNMLGYEQHELDGKPFSYYSHPDDVAENVEQSERLLRGEIGSFRMEKRYIRKDGSVLWANLTVSLVREDFDSSPFRLAMIEDISERKRSEKSLRESEERLRLITDNLPALIGYVDADGIYRFANKFYETAFGRPLEEIVGRPVKDILGPENYAANLESHRRVLGGETFTTLSEINLADGRTTYIMAHYMPDRAPDGAVRGFYVLAQDITELRHSEDAQRASLAHLNQAQRIAHIGSWEYNESTDELVWSDEVFRIFGVSKENFSPTRDKIQEFVHPDDRATMVGARERSQNGETDYTYDYRITRPDGDVRFLRNTVLVVARENDGAVRRAGTVQDITDQVKTQEQLRQSSKMEAVGQLTGGIAHDFNNLLAVMLGNLELIRDCVAAGDPVHEMVARGVSATERGAALTTRLLAFSRKQTLLPTDLDLNRLVAGMTDLLRRTLGETIQIKSAAAENLWLCLADQAQLENALLNLAINARDAMPVGGRLTVETANISLDDEYAAAQAEVAPGDYVMLGVSDTGTGIAKDMLKHVFEPFYTTKDVGRGTGLGLSMVHGFAKQSGGNVTIYSEPGAGTTVKLYLPRSAALRDTTVDRASRSGTPSARDGELVLVVEDDADVRTLAVALLSDLGYAIAEAGSAEAALDMLQHNPGIDLMLTDVVLPGPLNGPDLAVAVQRRYPAIRIVYMTGYAEEAFDSHVEIDKPAQVILKPFKKAGLARAVRSALDDKAG